MLDHYSIPQLEMLEQAHEEERRREALMQFDSVHYACAALFGGDAAKKAAEYQRSLMPDTLHSEPKSRGPRSPHRKR